jgi:hypothetical protein
MLQSTTAVLDSAFPFQAQDTAECVVEQWATVCIPQTDFSVFIKIMALMMLI